MTALACHASVCFVTPPKGEFANRLGDLARAHQPALEAFALKLCGDGDDARDLVQDTFERALKAMETQQPHTNERAWLFTILHHLFIDRHRRRMRAPRSTSIHELEVAAVEPVPPSKWQALTAEQVEHALQQLDEEFRVVYRLHVLEKRSYLEIASALGLPVNTVGTRILRARRKLRALLEAAAGEDSHE